MHLPKDPNILFSFINTQLRDNYLSLEALCDDAEVSAEELKDRLKAAGYTYDEAQKRFR